MAATNPRIAIFGGDELRASATALALEDADGKKPEVALVDLRDPAACVAAAALDRSIPRVAVADESQRALASALGIDPSCIATSCEPAAIGPLVVAALPRTPRRVTRVVTATAARGGVGRTLLVANLARRLAARTTVAAIDVTGTGALAWWLGVTARPWLDLEGLAEELTAEHLAVVATEGPNGIKVIGAAPSAPSRHLAESTVRAAAALTELVLVDAPPLSDERGRALAASADRALVLSYDDAMSLSTLDTAEVPEDVWLIASQSRATRIGERASFRALPRDEASVGAAFGKRGAVGGALGRAYDELAELIALDAS